MKLFMSKGWFMRVEESDTYSENQGQRLAMQIQPSHVFRTKKVVKIMLLYSVVLITAFSVAIALGNMTSGIYAISYAASRNVPLSSLSEDYGMGMVCALVFVSSFMAIFLLLTFFIIRIVRYFSNKNHKKAMLYIFSFIVSYIMAVMVAAGGILLELEEDFTLWFPSVFLVIIFTTCFCVIKAVSSFVPSSIS
jgi:hypothetical protein